MPLLEQVAHSGRPLLIDDGSTDDTPAVVAAFGERVRYLRGEHRGAGRSLAATSRTRGTRWQH